LRKIENRNWIVELTNLLTPEATKRRRCVLSRARRVGDLGRGFGNACVDVAFALYGRADHPVRKERIGLTHG
jgi:hypothetical protein